jgi:hypothetical protein
LRGESTGFERMSCRCAGIRASNLNFVSSAIPLDVPLMRHA